MGVHDKRPGVDFLRDLEGPLVYGMVIVTWVISAVVWGVTKIQSTTGGLLQELQPWFGAPYGIIVTALLALLLVHNRRWVGLAMIPFGYGVVAALSWWAAGSAARFAVDEWVAVSTSLSCALVALCMGWRGA